MKSNIPELFIIVLNNFSLFCTAIGDTGNFIFFSIKEEEEEEEKEEERVNKQYSLFSLWEM